MIILTGASGFVGRRILRKLQAAFGVNTIIAWTSKKIAGTHCILHEDYNSSTIYASGAPLDRVTTIIHAGAGVHDVNDEIAASRNIEVTELLLNAGLPRLSKFVFLSAIDVYDKSGIITEETQILPTNAYSRSKITCEKLVSEWAERHGGVGQILRVGHVYGPGEDHHKKVIPSMIRTILNGFSPMVYGEGQERRAFIYVDDVASAIVAALKLPCGIGPINIASRNAISMIDLAHLLLEIAGSEKPVEHVPTNICGADVVFDAGKCARYLLEEETPLRVGLVRELEYMRHLEIESAH
jgi:UDP-glucose 4-epimerase